MTKLGYHILFLLSLTISISYAQNLVRNSSFEAFSECPTFLGQIDKVTHWSSASNVSSPASFYHTCAGSFCAQCVPRNTPGFQWPRTGDGYIGIAFEVQKYVQTQLKSPLQKDSTYEISFWVSLPDNSRFAHKELNIYFSDSLIYKDRNDINKFTTITPQFQNSQFATDENNWVEIRGCVIADSAFDYIAIGAFKRTEEFERIELDSSKIDYSGKYLIDDVTVQLYPKNKQLLKVSGDTAICIGDTLILNSFLPEAAQYHWSNNATSPQISVSDTGLYTIQVVTTCGDTLRDSVRVFLDSITPLQLGNDTTLCPEHTLTLNVPLIYEDVIWQDGSTSFQYNITESGQYTATVRQGTCSISDTIDVTILPTFQLPQDSIICNTDTLLLSADYPNSNALWQDGSTTTHFKVAQQGVYHVAVQHPLCRFTDTIVVDTYQLPKFDFVRDTSFCEGDSIQLVGPTPIAAWQYSWSNGATTPTIWVKDSGRFRLNIQTVCGTFSDSTNTVIKPLPVNELGPDTFICMGDSITLGQPFTADSFIWSTHARVPQIVVASASTYHLTTYNNNCSFSDSIVVIQKDLPPVHLGPDTTICSADSLQIGVIALPNHQYNWGFDTNSFVQVRLPNTYALTVFDGFCTATDSMRLDTLYTPSVDLGNDTTICAFDTLILSAFEQHATYNWHTGAATPQLQVTHPDVYQVTVTVNQCAAHDEIQINQQQLPAIPVMDSLKFCEQDSVCVQLPNNPAVQFTWSDGINQLNRCFKSALDIDLIVVENGCTNTKSIHVSSIPLPVFELGADTAICAQQTLNIGTSIIADQLVWNTGAVTDSIEVTQDGNYSLSAIKDGCHFTDSKTVTVLPLPVIDLPKDTVICLHEYISLNIAPNYDQYSWSNGDQTSFTTVHRAGKIKVIAEHQSCIDSASVNIRYPQQPIITLPNNEFVCQGESLVLQVISDANSTTMWHDGTFDNPKTVQTSGWYHVVSQVDHCTLSDSIEILFYPKPTLDLGSDTAICNEKPITLTPVSNAAFYSWSTGEKTNTITVQTPGIYQVTATSAFQCSAEASILVQEQYENCEALITIPNAFSPNQDGVNDILKPVYNALVGSFTLKIYNRWGALVYEGNQDLNGWNGYFEGYPSIPGNYSYTLLYFDLQTNTQRQKSGQLTLLR